MSTTIRITRLKEGISGFLGKLHLESQTLLLIGIFVVLVPFFGLSNKSFLTIRSITSMAFQLPEIGVLSMAMMVTMLIGGINLSVNATANLAAVIAGTFLITFLPKEADHNLITLYIIGTILVAILVGVITGIINGSLIGYMGVPPILATLATLTLFTGISTGITGGRTVTGFPDQFQIIGSKTLAGIPIPFLVFVAVTIIVYILLDHTTFGFKARMLGSNETASKFSGINNKAINMKVYVLSGIVSSISGILIMSRTMSAAYMYGTSSYVLLTILVAVLAGVVPGFGNVLNVFVTVLILQVLSTGPHMLLMGVPGSSFFKDFSWGVLLIIIFVINYYVRGKKARE
jgi:simple sugar transport system permease protein